MSSFCVIRSISNRTSDRQGDLLVDLSLCRCPIPILAGSERKVYLCGPWWSRYVCDRMYARSVCGSPFSLSIIHIETNLDHVFSVCRIRDMGDELRDQGGHRVLLHLQWVWECVVSLFRTSVWESICLPMSDLQCRVSESTQHNTATMLLKADAVLLLSFLLPAPLSRRMEVEFHLCVCVHSE